MRPGRLYPGGHRRSTGKYFADGFEEFLRTGTFQQIAAGAGLQRLKNQFVIAINGNNDDLNLRKLFFQLGRAGDSGFSRQINIHHDQIGLLITSTVDPIPTL